MKPIFVLAALALGLGTSAGCSPSKDAEPSVIKAADKDRAPPKGKPKPVLPAP